MSYYIKIFVFGNSTIEYVVNLLIWNSHTDYRDNDTIRF